MNTSGISPVQLGNFSLEKNEKAREVTPDFARMLSNSLQKVNDLQNKADKVSQDFLLGKTDSLHRVTIAMEEAQLAYDLTLSIRDRILEGYRELMRMQF